MQSFDDLYSKVKKATVRHELDTVLKDPAQLGEFDKRQLECLLYPEKLPPVINTGVCDCGEDGQGECEKVCIFEALTRGKDGNITISEKNCTGCSACIEHCKKGNLTDRKDIVPVFEMLIQRETPVYAMIAPAFISQFTHEVTPGRLRTAFKKLGFEGMIEVALFADILTLKEALEFDHTIHNVQDYLLTSCCCPIWIAMIRKVYSQLVPHVPPSVSPMVACGRSIKKLHPDAKTVFIGPCVAKKAEAKEKDIAGSVDYVLTFQEMQEIFELTKIDPAKQPEDLRDHSSTAGRIYARTGGVSKAVKSTVERLHPGREIPLTARQANGVPECKKLLNEIMEGKLTANFLEGMGCVGGCVGGPKVLIDKQVGTEMVNEYGGEAACETPVDNPYVIELLHKLGFDSIESLTEGENMFTRKL